MWTLNHKQLQNCAVLSSSTRGSLIFCTISVHIYVPFSWRCHVFTSKGTRGWHFTKVCTMNCNHGSKFQLKKIIMELHIFCDCTFYLWNFAWPWPCISKRYSHLTVDYGEYFKWTVDLFWPQSQLGVQIVVECYSLAESDVSKYAL